MATPLVQATAVSKRFGGVTAILDVDIAVNEGELLGLIGPNGSGKTTLVNILSGVTPPTSGALQIDGRPVPFVRADRVVRRYRFARTFQNIRLCQSLSVADNVLVGMHDRFSPWSFVAPRLGREGKARRDATHILEFVGISHLGRELAGQLSYGDQRRVEIARALAVGPRLLMLDEPAAGMNPTEARRLVELIRQIAAEQVTMIVIEHNMAVVMNVADRVMVLDAGATIAQGAPDDVVNDPVVQEAYLGRRRSHAH